MPQWYELKGFGCPVKNCPGRWESYDWQCGSCGTTIYIAETGYLKCRSGKHNAPLIKWQFKCGRHGSHSSNYYQYADLQGFTFSLSHALQLMGKAGANWVGALCVAMEKQYK